jgi:hypothetical protein
LTCADEVFGCEHERERWVECDWLIAVLYE